MLDHKPDVWLMIEFIDKFEKWAWFEKFVADFILDVSDKMEEVIAVHLIISEKIPECVG